MRCLIALLVLSLCPMASVAAQPAPAMSDASGPACVKNVTWSQLPSGDDFVRDFPSGAHRMHIGGKVGLACGIGGDGRLTNCAVTSETPPDQQFGAAAIELSKLFRLPPLTKDGLPTAGGCVRFPIRFEPF
jgi:protein TonB